MRFHIHLGLAVACMMGILAAIAPADASSYQVVHNFTANGHDGSGPQAVLTQRGAPPGRLYGTTFYGGTYGCGTLFEVKPGSAGAETVKHSFDCSNDGGYPAAGLTFVDGVFYGTTSAGGTGTCPPCYGTVFSLVSKTNKETVLHSFKGAPLDGSSPGAGLINVGGVLYGATKNGGTGNCPLYYSAGCGVVFSYSISTGTEALVYSFKGGTDAAAPSGGLIDVRGVLFGTTFFGGTGKCQTTFGLSVGCGTVFSVDPATGTETVVHSFQNHDDGSNPTGALLKIGGKLYGTSSSGGINGGGVVFSIDLTTGRFRVLHSFGAPGDSSAPNGDLVAIGDTIYGTSKNGGTTIVFGVPGNYGTVFSVDRETGAETVLYSFLGFNAGDGELPSAGLINVSGTLYGTTIFGGMAACRTDKIFGCGTVFAFTP